MELQKKIEGYLGKAVNGASNKEIYYALLKLVKEMCKDKEPNKGSTAGGVLAAVCGLGGLRKEVSGGKWQRFNRD